MSQAVTNWFSGLFLILLGSYHIMSGSPRVGRWLQMIQPPIDAREKIMSEMGFAMGGYLAIAIGLTFLVVGNDLPRGYYLLWSIVFAVLGLVSVWSFKAFHASQLVWLLAISLGRYYAYAGRVHP